jgi:hypothetical protein
MELSSFLDRGNVVWSILLIREGWMPTEESVDVWLDQ